MTLDYQTTVADAADQSASMRYALDALARKPYYAFGATGPSAYDCSGLTMRAIAQLGVALPHNSSEQVIWFDDNAVLLRSDGRSNREHLIPGRTVAFYYGDVDNPDSVGHCALYLGRSRVRRLWMVAAAVDPNYNVIRHRMNRFLNPCGFGILR